ncbi:MAG TPA: MBL fold metallo-hydrolase [Actinomycetota bacterium]|nr:MBL fold metallo-hydrolase [Actinomycetota bacterium]
MPLRVFEHRVVGPLQCNCYVVGDPDERRAIVVDPGGDADAIVDAVASHGLVVSAIVATHAHFDHVVAAERVRALTGAPFRLHRADRPVLDWYQESGRLFLGIELPPPPDVDEGLDEGDVVRAGGVGLEVLHTPGHSPGSVCLVADGVVFSGDTLFASSVGRTDLPGGDADALFAAIRDKLFALDDDVRVYPGHGVATTLGAERRDNPFVGSGRRLWTPPA